VAYGDYGTGAAAVVQLGVVLNHLFTCSMNPAGVDSTMMLMHLTFVTSSCRLVSLLNLD